MKCILCGKHGKTHKKANFGRGRKGKSALKVPRDKKKSKRELILLDVFGQVIVRGYYE